jgi:membrane protein
MFGRIWMYLRETFEGWSNDNVSTLGAALAYYTVFSLAPLLIVVIAIAGVVFGRQAVEGQMVQQVSGLVGKSGAEAVQAMLTNAAQVGGGVWATVVAVVTTLIGASGVFSQLQSSINQIWEVRQKPNEGVKGFLLHRLPTFGMLLGVGFLLLVSLVVSAAVAALGTWLHSSNATGVSVLSVLDLLISVGVTTVLFAMIFRILPDAEIAWRDVWIGALSTAVLFTIGKFLIGLYLGRSSVSSAYGAAGSLVIILLWVNYSTQILFLGAEFTKVFASHRGSRIRPSDHALPAPNPAATVHVTEGTKQTDPSA